MDGPAHRTGDVIPFPTERLQDALIVDVDGFEGPLDLLLALARSQKVDLTRISILALAEQYLALIDAARVVRLEIAADYLVMAAWLAYLKSRLLLPEPEVPDEAPSGEELAAALAERLRKLEAIRAAARRLGDRAQLNRDVFARGMPEGIRTVRRSRFEASLHDLVAAYARRRQAAAARRVVVRRRTVIPLKDARTILERLLGATLDWFPLHLLLGPYLTGETGRGMLASSFAASLELAREGRVELRQTEPFGPILARSRFAEA